jgi:hypothetical protein
METLKALLYLPAIRFRDLFYEIFNCEWNAAKRFLFSGTFLTITFLFLKPNDLPFYLRIPHEILFLITFIMFKNAVLSRIDIDYMMANFMLYPHPPVIISQRLRNEDGSCFVL